MLKKRIGNLVESFKKVLLNKGKINTLDFLSVIAGLDGVTITESLYNNKNETWGAEKLWMTIIPRGMEGYLSLEVKNGQFIRLDEICFEENEAGEICSVPECFTKYEMRDWQAVVEEIKGFVR